MNARQKAKKYKKMYEAKRAWWESFLMTKQSVHTYTHPIEFYRSHGGLSPDTIYLYGEKAANDLTIDEVRNRLAEMIAKKCKVFRKREAMFGGYIYTAEVGIAEPFDTARFGEEVYDGWLATYGDEEINCERSFNNG